jgi:haloacetate dehalogenase
MITQKTDELVHHTVQANGIRQHYVEAGSGPPVILLHGFPLFWYQWRKMIPELCRTHWVIAPDLRGYGTTEKAKAGYDKRTMANDILALMRSLEIDRAAIVGHDRGARVATRFAKDHPEAISQLVVIDNIPTRVIFEKRDAKLARFHWFFTFNSVADLPEALITEREDIWLRWFFSQWCYDPECIQGKDFQAYVHAYQGAGALRGAMDDYRAAAEDIAQDNVDAEVKISCPVLALWGEQSPAIIGLFDLKAIWKQMTDDVQFVSIPNQRIDAGRRVALMTSGDV